MLTIAIVAENAHCEWSDDILVRVARSATESAATVKGWASEPLHTESRT